MNYLELLKKNNLKATPQRICILKALAKHTHPNIDELYEEIKMDYPSISLATVYKNLGVMINGGLAVELTIPNSKSKYDIYEYEHAHLVCKKCNSVFDISKSDAKLEEYEKHLEDNFKTKIEHINITAFISECSNCK